MSKDIKLNLDSASLKRAGLNAGKKLNRYKAFLFFLATAILYGFILYRVNVLSNPTAGQPTVQVSQSSTPHIDSSTVQKIQSLQDNSVSVQTLFDQARQNPFQE